jgi:hypothetical protein
VDIGRRRAATAIAVAALCAVAVACASGRPRPTTHLPDNVAAARSNLSAGLALYESADYTLAARRFELAGRQARAARDHELTKQAVTAACTAWLRARALPELADCTSQLEYLQRHSRRSDPGINTLIAMGAIAGQRPLPPFRVPNSVQPLLRQAAQEVPR